MDEKLAMIKPQIRAILLSLGSQTTEREFRKEYFENEEESFNKVLQEFNMSFYNFMRSMPDVCRVWLSGETVMIERVSSKESAHMDNLTIRKKKSKLRIPRFLLKPPPRSSSHFAHLHRSSLTNKGFPALQQQRYSASKPPFLRPQHLNHSTRSVTLMKLKDLPKAPHMMKKLIIIKADNEHYKEKEVLNLPPPHMRKPLITIKPNEIVEQPTVEIKNDAIPELDSSSGGGSSQSICLSNNQEEFDSLLTKMKNCQISSDDHTISTIPRPGKSSKKEVKMSWNHYIPPHRRNSSIVVKSVAENATNESIKTSTIAASLRPNSVTNEFAKSKNIATCPDSGLSTDEEPLVVPAKFPNNLKANLRNYVTSPTLIPLATCTSSESANKRLFFDIQILESKSPSHFIFQYDKSNLDSMMEEMNCYYQDPRVVEESKIRKLVPRLTVAAYDEGKWYRAEVKKIVRNEVTVKLIDFGAHKTLDKGCLRYLKNSFAKPSRKAYMGSLFGVKPKLDFWDNEAVRDFKKVTDGINLKATIKGSAGGKYQLTLIYDPLKFKRVHDSLIINDHAEMDYDADFSMDAVLI